MAKAKTSLRWEIGRYCGTRLFAKGGRYNYRIVLPNHSKTWTADALCKKNNNTVHTMDSELLDKLAKWCEGFEKPFWEEVERSRNLDDDEMRHRERASADGMG